jgi:predicted porin
VHSLSLNADFAATEKLLLTAGASYSDARAEWDELSITYNAPITDAALLNIYNPALLSEMTAYSDLHYVQTDITLGGTYRFTPALYATAQSAWQKFEDKDPYVYGDQDGTAWRASVGVGYKF